MKFKVHRTSCWDDNISPCEEAVKETFDIVSIRPFNSFDQFDKIFGEREGAWLSRGTNHCINKNGYIQRTLSNSASGWFVDIGNLFDLIEFIKKYEPVVISRHFSNTQVFDIEIYDDYRE